MKVAITGVAGFIGSHLTERLLDEGHKVIGFDNFSTGRKENINHMMEDKNFKLVEKDISAILSKDFNGVDWVVHAAALADIVPSINDPIKYHDTNVNGTIRVLEAARKSKIKKFIYIASSSCYGLSKEWPTQESVQCDPRYPYALTKKVGEDYVMHWGEVYKLPVISLRLFNVYGPRSRTNGSYGAVFGVFLAQKANNKPFTIVGNGHQSRDFIYVTDVTKAISLALNSKYKQKIYNIGSGHHYTIKTLANYLEGRKMTYLPKRPGEPDITHASIVKANQDLGWSPAITFHDGCKKMLAIVDKYKEAPVWDSEKIHEATAEWFRYLGGRNEGRSRYLQE